MDGSGGGWIIEVTYGAAMDWDEWTEQDGFHTFKLDCGELDDDHDNWDYRILESGSMIGTGLTMVTPSRCTTLPPTSCSVSRLDSAQAVRTTTTATVLGCTTPVRSMEPTSTVPETSSVISTAACHGALRAPGRQWMTARTRSTFSYTGQRERCQRDGCAPTPQVAMPTSVAVLMRMITDRLSSVAQVTSRRVRRRFA